MTPDDSPPSSDSPLPPDATQMATPVPAASLPSLWRNRPYMALLTGETIQGFGVEIAQVAIPIIAVTYLMASEFEMGLLAAAEGTAFLILSLPVGAWVDRLSRRSVMMWANLVRAATMAAVPILWFTGTLEIHWLMVGALVISAAAVFFDMAYMSIVPSLVHHDHLDTANSRLQTTAEAARAAGPGLGGLLARFVTAPLLPLAATAGYLASAWSIRRIPRDERPDKRHDASLIKEIKEGLSFVFRHPFIRPLVTATSVSNLFGNVAFAMFPLLLLRDLELSPVVYGLILTSGSVGGITGALVAPWFSRRFGEGHAIPVTYAFASAPMFVFPTVHLMPSGWAIGSLIASSVVSVAGVVAYNVVQVSMRQRQCPPRMLGRMTASIRFVIWGVAPIGAIASGLIATHWGITTALWIGAVGNALGVLLLIASPLWRMGTVPVVAPGPYRARGDAQ